MTLSLYIVVAIYSTVYSYRRLHRPGVSAPVRSLFVKKHFLYVVVFIVIWMIQQSNNYYYLFNPTSTSTNPDTNSLETHHNVPILERLSKELGFSYTDSNETTDDDSDNKNYVTIASGLMTFSTGIFLTCVRLIEPLFRVIFAQQIYQFFGKIYEPKFKDVNSVAALQAQDQALNSILTSSLNVELVYVVLKSISSFSQDTLGSGRAPNHTDGLVVTTDIDQDPITEIDLEGS